MTKIPKTPGHLSIPVRHWFRSVVSQYELDESALKILVAAGECLDRNIQARDILKSEGLTFTDKFGSPRKHPCVSIELDSKLAFSRLMKTLSLPSGEDVGPVPGNRSHKRKSS